MNNRRNYYRVLHVQPEAPLEVIRASYRSMMSKLRHHPDLGGDHEVAVLLNEAYAVLCDPRRRKLYDESMGTGVAKNRAQFHDAPVAAPALPVPAMRDGSPLTSRSYSEEFASAEPALRQYRKAAPLYGAETGYATRAGVDGCAFCGLELPRLIRRDTRCRRCESPLAPPAGLLGGDESACRRSLPRVAKADAVRICPDWRDEPRTARLRDLSLTGVSVVTDFAAPAQAVVRIVASGVDLVAEVVSCREEDGQYSLHARIVNAIFTERPGVFLSLTA